MTKDESAPPEPAGSTPLIAEAVRKASVAWIATAGGPARVMWCHPVDGALYLVTGAGEQSGADLVAGEPASVTLRGDHGGRIVTWPAEVALVEPGSADWDAVAPQVAAKRLNAAENPADLVSAWATRCRLYRLTPADGPVAAGSTLPDDSLAAPPRPNPAVRRTRRPFRLHRVRRR
ncbi:pyridoxamine 5'-phosphate oxidase family protein [Solwaraspora sp. WMMA2101]|uniref:pyridoxamine 5'-phosphate oxidase family protein n=1 Tax=Solwaraspora sp. WMMA2101 TaxID=3404124 RepID=UPI003B925C0E